MKKPKPESIVRYDYFDSLKYVFDLLDYPYDSHHKVPWNKWVWDFFGSTYGDGATIYIPDCESVSDQNPNHGFIRTVISKFHEEFGEDARYHVFY